MAGFGVAVAADVIAGAELPELPELTVRIAPVLVTFPVEFVTVTVNTAPLSLNALAGVVYDADVAPEMFVPFF